MEGFVQGTGKKADASGNFIETHAGLFSELCPIKIARQQRALLPQFLNEFDAIKAWNLCQRTREKIRTLSENSNNLTHRGEFGRLRLISFCYHFEVIRVQNRFPSEHDIGIIHSVVLGIICC